MSPPLFTLLTDYGAGSGYPAQVKGVLLAALPDARIVDVSHEVARHDVLAGALLLEACAPWFPRGAIHVAVVDPGVGTARRALCAVDPEGRRFVAPGQRAPHPVPRPGHPRLRARARRRARRAPERHVPRPRPVRARRGPPRARRGAGRARPGGGRPGAAPLAPRGRVAAPRCAARRSPRIRSGTSSPRSARPTSPARPSRASRWTGARRAGFGPSARVVPASCSRSSGAAGGVELAVREASAAALLGRARGAAVRLVLVGREGSAC